jgi:hypothetical protein
MTSREPQPRKKTAKGAPLAPPGDREAAAIKESTARVLARRKLVAVAAELRGDHLFLSSPHADALGFQNRLLDAFGTRSHAFVDEHLKVLGNSVRSRTAKTVTEQELNAALAALDGIRPRDEAEAMLAVQMVATNRAALDMLARARQADYLPAMQDCGNLAVKLLRTYTAQIEALAKLRRGGEQTVRVEHVHVHSGGQAVVGVVENPGRGSQRKSEDQGDAKQIAHAPQPAVWSADQEREPVPVASDAERPMSNARRNVTGSAEGK